MQTFDSFVDEVRYIAERSSNLLSRLSGSALYADLFLESTVKESLHCERATSTAKKGTYRTIREHIHGAGIYAFNERASAHRSVSGAPGEGRLQERVKEMIAVLGKTQLNDGYVFSASSPQPFALHTDNPENIATTEKNELIERIVDASFSCAPQLKKCAVEYQDTVRRIFLVNTEGQLVNLARAGIAMQICTAVEYKGVEIEACVAHHVSGRFGELSFGFPEKLAVHATDQLGHSIEAQPIRSGRLEVVFAGAKMGGEISNAAIWLHEAIGHFLEADHASLENHPSLLKRRLASADVTIYDDATLESPHASVYDDEGVPATRTTLIDRGVQVNVLTDRYRSMLLDISSSGNGRRQDYRFPPLPRMTNLCLAPGTDSPQDIVSFVKKGLFITRIRHGYTNPENNTFYLHVQEGFFIENGRLTHPVSDILLQGNGLEILQQIACIGMDMPVRSRTIRCQKNGQVVPVSVRAPTVLVRDMDAYQKTP